MRLFRFACKDERHHKGYTFELPMALHVLGINHHSAPLEVRERLAFAPEAQPEALAELAGQPGVAEAVLLSTCNRTEIYCRADDGAASARRWLLAPAARSGLGLG